MGNITLKSLLAVDSHVINPLVYRILLLANFYKRPREGAEKGVVLLSVRYGTIGLCIGSKRGAAFSEAFSHLNLLSTKNETPEKS